MTTLDESALERELLAAATAACRGDTDRGPHTATGCL